MKYAYLLIFTLVLSQTSCEQIDLTVVMHEGAGFFCELHKVVQAIIHFENKLTHVYVDWTDEFFPYKDSPTENGWDLFFEPITIKRAIDPQDPVTQTTISFVSHELHDQECTSPWVEEGYKKFLPYRQSIHRILTEYIHIKPEISKILNYFYDTHLKGHVCIGVHARIAKQHRSLIPGNRLPDFEEYFAEVDRLLTIHKNDPVKIFVASDSHYGVDQFKNRYGSKVICIDAYRSVHDNDPCLMYTSGEQLRENPELWHRIKHKKSGGISTFVDSLLLSKCDYLIRTTSNLAFFATYYNPEIKTVYLPRSVRYKECRFKDNPSIKNPYINP